jgi:hypothetical protein
MFYLPYTLATKNVLRFNINKVPSSNQENGNLLDKEVYSLSFSKMFLLDCRIVPTVWYIVVFHFIVINPSLFYLIKYWFVVFPLFLSDQLYVAYGYVVVLQIVLSPVLEHNVSRLTDSKFSNSKLIPLRCLNVFGKMAYFQYQHLHYIIRRKNVLLTNTF